MVKASLQINIPNIIDSQTTASLTVDLRYALYLLYILSWNERSGTNIMCVMLRETLRGYPSISGGSLEFPEYPNNLTLSDFLDEYTSKNNVKFA